MECPDRDRMLRSDHPSDKHLMLEGELFAGLYEGYTVSRIEETILDEDGAMMTVRFSNEHYDIHWSDTPKLMKDDTCNLNDKGHSKGGTQQQTLKEFISV